MSVLSMFRRLRGSVRTSAFERDRDAERRHHLDLETEALVARGMTPARRAAAIDPMRAPRADWRKMAATPWPTRFGAR